MSHVAHLLLSGLLMAAAMAWKTGWSLVLGFAVSAALQVLVATDRLRNPHALPMIGQAFAMEWRMAAAMPGARTGMGAISLDYSFWLNLVALVLAGYLFVQGRKHPGHHQ